MLLHSLARSREVLRVIKESMCSIEVGIVSTPVYRHRLYYKDTNFLKQRSFTIVKFIL